MPSSINLDSKPCIVVGAGKMGLLHGALAQRTEGLDVMGIVDSSFQSRMIAKGIGLRTPIFSDINRAQKGIANGVAIICTPPSSHYSISKSFLENDWSVFVEKPLTMDPNKSLELHDIAESRSLFTQIGFQQRFSPVTRFLKEMIAEESEKNEDKLVSIEASILSPQFSQIEDKGLGLIRGGVEWDLFPHVIDLCLFLTDTRKLEETSIIDSVVNGWKSIDSEISIGGTINCSLRADWGTDEVRKVECSGKIEFGSGKKVCFDPDSVTMAESGRVVFHRRKGANPSFEIADQEYSFQMQHLASSLNSGNSFPSADFLTGWIVDSIISEISEVGNVDS